MDLELEIVCTSVIGNIRTNNEDNFYFDGTFLPMINNGTDKKIIKRINTDRSHCFIVFDGMGGESYGEKAAYLATTCFSNEFKNKSSLEPKKFLIESCYKMNDVICKEQEKDRCSMGTTMAGLYFIHDDVYICNLGDSKIYRFSNNELKQLSVSHVVPIVSFNPKMKPALTQNLGIPEEEMKLEPFIDQVNCRQGDIYLICSDGLTDMISDEEISDILCKNDSISGKLENMMELALKHGGKDNITIILGKVL